jgi:hypothetical protein
VKSIRVGEVSNFIHIRFIPEMCRHTILFAVASFLLLSVESAPQYHASVYDDIDDDILRTLDDDNLDILSDDELDRLILKVKQSSMRRNGRFKMRRSGKANMRRLQNIPSTSENPELNFVPNCKRWQIC